MTHRKSFTGNKTFAAETTTRGSLFFKSVDVSLISKLNSLESRGMKRRSSAIGVLILSLSLFGLVGSYPNGAGSCDSPEKRHGAGTKGDGGYVLKVVSDEPILPNKKVDLVLSGEGGKTFKGFQIIAETGSFDDSKLPDGVQLNTADCILDGRVTHTTKADKESVTVPYKVPKLPGTVKITYYVVEEFSKWYGPLTLQIPVLLLTSDSTAEPETPPAKAAKPSTTELEEGGDQAEGPMAEQEQKEENKETVTNDEKKKTLQRVKKKILSVFNGQCTESPIEGYDCVKEFTDFFSLHWRVGEKTPGEGRRKLSQAEEENPDKVPAKGEVLFGLEGETDGWVAIAFPEEKGEMDPADSVIGWVDEDGEAVVKPYRIMDKNVRSDDVDEGLGVEVVAASEENGVTFIEFIKVADEGNVPFDIQKDVHLNYAIGKADRLEEHPSHGKGSVTLNLQSGRSRRVKSDAEVYYMVHGSLMLIGWIFFLPLGISIARHRWTLPMLGESGWIDLHRFVQLFSVICIITAVIIGLSRFEDVHSTRGKAHVTLAVILLICLFVQGTLGVFRPKPDHPRRGLFNNVHGWLGRFLAAGAVLTVLLGIAALKQKLRVDVTGWVASVILICLFHIILAFAAELALQKKRRGGSSKRIGEVDMTDMGTRVGYTRGLDEGT
ncbi:hypothetical protein BSKO_09398 [Bryopsis sp. KO-2023]|nr:hypothetical protein BSKO_09398 [Bryopsis sp. KO-2023]